jgi:hypothetical protein
MPINRPTAADAEAGMWRGYINANDDVRGMYEQVFYGRQLTGASEHPDPPAAVETKDPGLNGEVLPPEQPTIYQSEEGPPQVGFTIDQESDPAASFYGYNDAPDADFQQIEGPKIEAPTIEAPQIEPPNQGDDMQPGY